MKNKKILLVIILVFVLLIGGASVLYRQLGQKVEANQLMAEVPAEAAPAEPEASEEEAPAEAAPAEPEASEEEAPVEAASAEPEAPAEESEEEPEYVKAPDFTVYDVDGNEVNLYDFLGKPIVLNFWASWCGPCQMEMPAFHEKYLELGDEVQFLMINSTVGRETKENAVEFLEENGYTFPVYYDMDYHASMMFGAFSLPQTFFLDEEGYAVGMIAGAINAEILQMGIDLIV